MIPIHFGSVRVGQKFAMNERPTCMETKVEPTVKSFILTNAIGDDGMKRYLRDYTVVWVEEIQT